MTPSGLVIGMILNTILFLNSIASGFVGLVMNLIKPYMIKEAFVSPGCTLAHIMIYFLNLLRGSVSGFENSLSSISSKVF